VFYTVPIAALATMPAAISNYTYTSVFCQIEEVPNAILAAGIALNFIFTVLAQIYGMREASKTVPGSVLRRSMRIIFRYNLAYWSSFGLFIWFCMLRQVLQIHWTRVAFFVESLAWRLLLMNGFFNFVALRLHVKEAAFHPDRLDQSSVAFSLSVQVREVNSINHNIWASDCENQIQRIREDNLELWEQLGILEACIEEEERLSQESLQTSQRNMHVEQPAPVKQPSERRDRGSLSRPKGTKPARSSSWQPDAAANSPRGTSAVFSGGHRHSRTASFPQSQQQRLEDKSFWDVVGRC
jgi:hypothetical protein